MTSRINLKKRSVVIISLFVFCLPLFAYGVVTQEKKNTGLVYDCELAYEGVPAKTDPRPGECTFYDLIYEVQNIVAFGRNLGLELSVIVLAIAGFKYMTSGGNASKRAEANQMLLKVVYGIIFIIAAWLIVSLITSTLLKGRPTLENIFR